MRCRLPPYHGDVLSPTAINAKWPHSMHATSWLAFTRTGDPASLATVEAVLEIP